MPSDTHAAAERDAIQWEAAGCPETWPPPDAIWGPQGWTLAKAPRIPQDRGGNLTAQNPSA